MRRIDRPTGLIRYTSHNAVQGMKPRRAWLRPQVLAPLTLILLAFAGIAWGLTHMNDTTLKVRHIRQPLFVRLSNGSIQNRYEVRVFNKSDQTRHYRIEVITTAPVEVVGVDDPLSIGRYSRASASVLVRAAAQGADLPLTFRVTNLVGPSEAVEYRSYLARPGN
jgi:polyferredoxin